MTETRSVTYPPCASCGGSGDDWCEASGIRWAIRMTDDTAPLCERCADAAHPAHGLPFAPSIARVDALVTFALDATDPRLRAMGDAARLVKEQGEDGAAFYRAWHPVMQAYQSAGLTPA